MVDETNRDEIVDDTEIKDVPDEVLSAQFLRRVHADKTILLQDYHEALQHIEHSAIRKWAETSLLPAMEEIMTSVEELFEKYHSSLPPIEGAMTKDIEEDDDEDDIEDVDETGADSTDDREEEIPTEDEAIEGMRKAPSIKRKSLCARCNKSDCKCNGKQLESNETDMQEEDEFDQRVRDENDFDDLTTKALGPDERSKIEEISKFLKDVSEAYDLEDEHRLKSYHYSKVLEPMSGTNEIDDVEKSVPGGPEWLREESAEAAHKYHPHRKMCSKACKYLKALSTERAFGDVHRSEAAALSKEMEDAVNEELEEEVGMVPVDEGNVRKGIDLKSVLVKQRQQMKDLVDTMNSLNGMLRR